MLHKERTGIFQGFSGYSYKNYRKFNEDKLDININYVKQNKQISLYSIYDGHGGDYVSNYLRDNLHNELISNEQLLRDPKKTILDTYYKIENTLLTSPIKCYTQQSGACALLLMTINNTIIIANLGDSRGVISLCNGEVIHSISIDHKLTNETEKQRVIAFGGIIKRVNKIDRVFPGGLSVSRSLGDGEMKMNQKGDTVSPIISVPDIFCFEYKQEMDYIFLGSDGIYESITNKNLVLTVYNTLKKCIAKARSYSQMLEKVIYNINKLIIAKGIKDNLTSLFLPFDNFKRIYDRKDIEAIDIILKTIKESQSNGERIYEDIQDGYVYKKPNAIGNYTNGVSNNNISSWSSNCLTNKTKSTVIQQNIRLYECSFTKSNISIENKRNTSQMPPISELDTSFTSKGERKVKEKKVAIFCCGLFTSS